jgi:hypothetical protein
MHKILKDVIRELKQIEEQGVNGGNIELLSKLVDIRKDIDTIMAMEDEYPLRYGEERYNSPYGTNYGYGYGRENYAYNPYGRQGGGHGGHRGDMRMADHLDRIMDAADAYSYGRERYRDGGGSERLEEGLEKVMYAVCTFVESIIDFAETPQEKEIVRKHLQKMKSI